MENTPEQKLEKLIRQELRKLPEMEAPQTLIPQVMTAIQREQQLEKLIHRNLQVLSEFDAPGSLIPRVLSAIQARANLSWWQRPLLTWPPILRVLSLALLLAGLGLAGYFGVMVWESWIVAGLFGKIAQGFTFLSPLWDILAAVANAIVLLLKSVNQFYLVSVAGVLMLMYLSCVGLGTVCFRVIFHKR